MSPQPIRLGDPHNFVQIDLLERGTIQAQSEGDLRLAVSVRSDGFSGEYDQVWIAHHDWTAFIESLKRLELQRTGRASLLSMSPEEFELHLQITDRAGHLAAHGCLSRYHIGLPGGHTKRSRIEYALHVDPSRLSELVTAFSYFQSDV